MTAQGDTSREAKSIWLKTSLFTLFWEKGAGRRGGRGVGAGRRLAKQLLQEHRGRDAPDGRGGAGGA